MQFKLSKSFQSHQNKLSVLAVLANIENIDHRAVIKYLFKNSLKTKAIHPDRMNILGRLESLYFRKNRAYKMTHAVVGHKQQ